MSRLANHHIVTRGRSRASAWKVAVELAERLCLRTSNPRRGVVVVTTHRKSLLSKQSVALLGEELAADLHQARRMRLPSGLELNAETPQTLPRAAPAPCILAFQADDALMLKLDDYMAAEELIAVPKDRDSCAGWIARWNPLLPTGESMSAAAERPDPVVAAAIQDLTDDVNLGNVILHRRDKQLARETLLILRSRGYELNVEHVLNLAFQQGWRMKGAEQLSELARSISKLKAPKPTGLYDAEILHARWMAMSEGGYPDMPPNIAS